MARNRKRKGTEPFVPKSQRDFDREQRQAAQSAQHAAIPSSKFNPTGADTRTFDERRAQDKARTRRAQQRIQATSGNAPAFKPTPVPRTAPHISHLGRNVAIGAAATAAIGGGGYLVHRHQRSKTMAKNYVDPFTEVVAFGKAYPVVIPVPNSRRVPALVPTGGYHSDANRLVHVTHRAKGHRQGPFGKGLFSFGARRAAKSQVARGLAMAAGTTGPSPEVARGLKMAAGHTGRMPLTGATGTSVIAPARRGSMAGPGGPLGSKYVSTSRMNHNNPAYGNGPYKGRHAGYRSADSKGVESNYAARHRAGSVNSKIPDTGRTGLRVA